MPKRNRIPDVREILARKEQQAANTNRQFAAQKQRMVATLTEGAMSRVVASRSTQWSDKARNFDATTQTIARHLCQISRRSGSRTVRVGVARFKSQFHIDSEAVDQSLTKLAAAGLLTISVRVGGIRTLVLKD